MRRKVILVGLAAVAAVVAAGVMAAGQSPNGEPITPLPGTPHIDAVKVELGRKLFHDPRLSHDRRVSCASCHDLERGGADGHARAVGSDGRLLDYNSPTVFNAALNFRLNWRGNFRALEEQNEQVLLDPRLMGTTWAELLARLQADTEYATLFQWLYGQDPKREHVLDGLATFQRSLATPRSRFDRYLAGERDALTDEEGRGYDLFKAYGCAACHQGANVGGNLFQRFGVFHNPFAERGSTKAPDLGRFTLTGNDSDRYVFRVPSLRNVAVTGPYFHDGSVGSLAEAVEIMGRSQLGRDLSNGEIDLIVKFLGTLTGTYRGRPLGTPSGGSPR